MRRLMRMNEMVDSDPPRGIDPRGGFHIGTGFRWMSARESIGAPTPRPGFTLVEMILVVALLVLLSSLVVPVFTGELERRRLNDSIEQLQNMIAITRAHAMNDGLRYRLRWPDEEAYDEADEAGKTLQPVIEVEAEPIEEPGEFSLVTELWAQVEPLHKGIQVTEVRLGRPKTAEELIREEEERERLEMVAEGVEEMFEDDEDEIDRLFGDSMDEAGTEDEKDPTRPAVVFESDGTVEWATIELTNGEETEDGELRTWEVIIDGRTGKVGWRRSLTEEEIEMRRSEIEEQREEKTIVRGRELGAK